MQNFKYAAGKLIDPVMGTKGKRGSTITKACIAQANLAADLLKVLLAMKRCPGSGHTDQETGETFDYLIDTAVAKATGESNGIR